MGNLHIRTYKLLDSSLSFNSNATYKTAMDVFDKFRALYQLPLLWPADKNHIVLFISYCFECGYAPSTIVTYVSGISFKHKLNSWYDPSQLFVIKKLLEGCKRSRKRCDSRAPVTQKMLNAICQSLATICYNEYESIMFKSVYCLAYYGLLRVSEVTFASVLQADRPLKLRDISFNRDAAVLLTIRMAKNNQRGQPTIIKIPCMPDDSMCPVCLLRSYLKLRSNQPGQLFIHGNGKPLTRSQFSSVLDKAVRGSEFKHEHIKSHSFRIGRASELASLGVDSDIIKTMGRWKSDAYKSYIRL